MKILIFLFCLLLLFLFKKNTKIDSKIATDPKLALQKGRELWADLSKDEPENQARPQTIEELIVLITRESARRMVHLANYTGTTASKVPRCDSLSSSLSTSIAFQWFWTFNLFLSLCPYSSLRDVLHNLSYAADSLARTTHLDKVKATAVQEAYVIIDKVSLLYGFLQLYSSNALVSNGNFLRVLIAIRN